MVAERFRTGIRRVIDRIAPPIEEQPSIDALTPAELVRLQDFAGYIYGRCEEDVVIWRRTASPIEETSRIRPGTVRIHVASVEQGLDRKKREDIRGKVRDYLGERHIAASEFDTTQGLIRIFNMQAINGEGVPSYTSVELPDPRFVLRETDDARQIQISITGKSLPDVVAQQTFFSEGIEVFERPKKEQST